LSGEGDASQNNEGAATVQSGSEGTREGGGLQRPGLPGSYFREKPVKLGEELDVSISELSKRGDGVARVQGYVIFVPKCQQGQQVRIKITMIRPSYAVAEVVQGPPPTP
jgi:predicted RNA-binding protein with TRAM domain